jgi:predicted dehydrogenase
MPFSLRFARLIWIGLLAAAPAVLSGAETKPLRIGLVGLVHGHVGGFFDRLSSRKDIQLVGIGEPDQALAGRYGNRYKLASSLMYSDIEKMLNDTKPEAVAIFTNTFDHAQVVEACAKRGIHVMMEKPLAVSMEHARRMEAAARAHHIHVLVNYETTWFPNTPAAYDIVHGQKAIGPIRKMVIHDGHRGPKEIGVSVEFLKWLSDPVLNGGGALTDFGCYGADLMTWLMDGARPTTVTAVTQQIKPEIYPKVDDEANIIVTYPKAVGIIQASWNWAIDRKDMEIYGQTGFVETLRRDGLRVHLDKKPEEQLTATKPESPMDDPISYLMAVVRGSVKPTGLSALDTNIVVTEILDAARQSAASHKTIQLQ